jgi:hypothetical protein
MNVYKYLYLSSRRVMVGVLALTELLVLSK